MTEIEELADSIHLLKRKIRLTSSELTLLKERESIAIEELQNEKAKSLTVMMSSALNKLEVKHAADFVKKEIRIHFESKADHQCNTEVFIKYNLLEYSNFDVSTTTSSVVEDKEQLDRLDLKYSIYKEEHFTLLAKNILARSKLYV